MTTKTDGLIDELLRLPRESRALLAEKLLESLDRDEDHELSPEWLDEVKRRCREIDAQAVTLVSEGELFEELDRDLG